jgi:predicted RNase H-like nuclease
MMTMVAGVDGCRAGWLVALRPLESPAKAKLSLFRTFEEVLALGPCVRVIAVDIPIGLPERGGPGGRLCDREARAGLGGRQSAVFAIPSRSAVMCESYPEACRVAELTSDPPKKVSKQAFNIFAKIREVDLVMTPQLQSRVCEVHPEVAFWALNGKTSLEEPKKLKSRPYPAGLALRRRLLAAAGYAPPLLNSNCFSSSDAGPDDVLDAVVNSWSAARIARGEACRFPAHPPRDARELKMEILA